MLKKVKTGLIIFAVLFLAGAVVTVNIQTKKIKRLKSENTRLDNNNYQLMSDNRKQTNLVLKEKEVTGKLKKERDSLAKSLQIKPKQIEKIITIQNIVHDTVKISVPVEIVSKGVWNISDSDKCFQWHAKAVLKGDSLNINRTLFFYNNKTIEVFWQKRPFNFLFIHLGKPKNYQQISSECGEVIIKSFQFIGK